MKGITAEEKGKWMKCEVTDCEEGVDEFLDLDSDDGWNLCQFHYDLVTSIHMDAGTGVEEKGMVLRTMGLRRHTDLELEEGISLRGQRMGAGNGGGC